MKSEVISIDFHKTYQSFRRFAVKKVLILSIIVLSLMFTFGIINSSYAGNLSQDEKKSVMNLIEKVLKQQNLSLKNSESPIITPEYVTFAGKKYTGNEYIEEQFNSFQNMQSHGIQCIKSSSEIVENDCMRLEDDSVDCYVSEVIKSTYVADDDLSDPVESVEKRNIKFNLKQDGRGLWVIKNQVMQGLQPNFPQPTNVNDVYEEQQMSIKSFKTINIFDINSSVNAEKKVTTGMKGRGYNGTVAAAYARQYAYNYNPAYRSWGSDCTNFASQAVKAGGWVYDYGYYLDAHNWWYNFFNQTRSWVNAHYFWWFNEYSNRSYLVNSTCNLDLGDIVSADWNRDYYVDHQMVVTKKIGCNIWLSYHSNDNLNKPFWELPSDAYYWGWNVFATD